MKDYQTPKPIHGRNRSLMPTSTRRDKPSAIFLSEPRKDADHQEKWSKKDYNDHDLDVKFTAVNPKPVCFVKKWKSKNDSDDEQKPTVPRKAPRHQAPICSKGTTECRHSDYRLKEQIAVLSHLSPKIEEFNKRK